MFENIISNILKGTIIVVTSIGATFGIGGGIVTQSDLSDFQTSIQPQEEIQLGSFLTVGGKPYYLYGGGIGTTDSSITLTAFKTPVSNYNLQMADFGEIGYLTLEPGSLTRQEFVSFTGITQNSDGSATLTGVTRGLSPVSPYTASTTLQKAHSGGSVAVISNPPQLYEQFATRSNTESITGVWTYSSSAMPKLDTYVAPTSSLQFATKGYADALAFDVAGVATSTETATGLVEIATAIETASSTTNGTESRLAIPADLATSTYNSATADLKVVVTQNNGKIDSNFIATSTLFGLGSAFSIGAITTDGVSNIGSSTIRTYTATTTSHNGNYVWTKPANLKLVIVEMVGGGGGSAGSTDSGTANEGGGGGAYGKKILAASVLGSTVDITVGRGGPGGAGASSGAGTTGGTSSFGSHCSGVGGSGGQATSEGSAGGGATSANCDISIPGGSSGPSNSSASLFVAGNGGHSMFGFGPGVKVNESGITPSSPITGMYGAGARGHSTDSASDINGSAGHGGIVILTEVYY